MSARNVLESQQSVHAATAGRRAVAGCWKLAAGRALSLHPQMPGMLEIVQGQVWLTFGTPHAGQPAREADWVLQAGEHITIPAGRHVVVEAWTPRGAPQTGVAFDWKAVPAAAPTQPARGPDGAEWQRSVAQPVRELLQALHHGGLAVGRAGAQVLVAASRVAWGTARFALFRIAVARARTPV